jgi:hypothetical protein
LFNEKTASGRPKPDVRTVARLVELGWSDTSEAAEAVLTRRKTNSRYAFETAGPAIDWLSETLGNEQHSSGRCLAAHAVFRSPSLLTYNTSLLQRGWELVIMPRAAGGFGLSGEIARRRVAAFPPLLSLSREFIQKRATFLEMLGVPDGRAAIVRDFNSLGYAEDKLRSNTNWMAAQGLDVKRILSAQPSLLRLTAKALAPKLDFVLNIVGLDISEVESRFLVASLENVLRPRFFYAMQHGASQRFTLGTLVKCADARFLKMINRMETPASVNEVTAYKAHIASPAFLAYMDEQERTIRATRGVPAS